MKMRFNLNDFFIIHNFEVRIKGQKEGTYFVQILIDYLKRISLKYIKLENKLNTANSFWRKIGFTSGIYNLK